MVALQRMVERIHFSEQAQDKQQEEEEEEGAGAKFRVEVTSHNSWYAHYVLTC